MKKNLFIFPILFFFSSLTGIPQDARIKIDIEREIGTIDPLIYGNFVEHLGRCIYGGIYDLKSKYADKKGFRTDVKEAVKELNVTILRWPGGNFVSGYHWEDGIGPRESRPVRIDLARGSNEPNIIGTDEFIPYCLERRRTIHLCKPGTRNTGEARNWVEYCNVEKGTYYSELRRENGSESPYNVKYWGLGNEIDGPWQMGHKNAEDYDKYALEAAKLMKWVDPGIKLVISGSSNYGQGVDWMHWNRTETRKLNTSGSILNISFPAHSYTMVKMAVTNP